MRKILILLAIVFLAIVGFIIMSNENNDNFDFSLRYSVDGKDFISTIDNTLKIDTVSGVKIIDFELTKEDLKRIQDKIQELEIIETDFQNMPFSGVTFSNLGIYELHLQVGEKTKTIYWTTENTSPVLSASIKNGNTRYSGEYGRVYRLFDLKDFIVEIIEEYDEYIRLPAHRMYN